MTLAKVSLGDKFDLTKDRVFVSGTQALVRMLLMQRARDEAAGLKTAGYVSGYRGSPLGGFDQQLWKARNELKSNDIVFQPGLNEELAATSVWGTQQAGLYSKARHDGVFGLWYGKGPGVDRSGDVFRHANLAGTSKHGGVLALMGDDHGAESSTNAHQTEFQFLDVMMPILNPAGVQEMLDYGLYGYALSRFSGNWVAFKCVKDNVESTASVDGRTDRVQIIYPELDLPADGIHIRAEIDFLGQEVRMHEHKRRAAAAFVLANRLNTIVYSGGKNAKIGIVTTGKSYLDTRQAFDDLGIDEAAAQKIGIRLFKVGCVWPFDRMHFAEFADGLDMIICVEEKRSLLETQIRENLYGIANQPILVGKRDEQDNWLFPIHGVLEPNQIAIAIGERILRLQGHVDGLPERISRLKQHQAMLATTQSVGVRTPYFCSGCPHNSSTKVPEGSRAAAGIGCHFMALWMDRETHGFTAMGGEGAQWVGEANFSEEGHIFQNIGDGTYNHSGVLALRFAVSAKTNMTYKILYNDAVAMTGGQPHEGALTVDQIAQQVRAEGVDRIAIVTDEPEKYAGHVVFPDRATIHHRDQLDDVQRELRDLKGVTVLIYDQTCAAEKRRRRKRGTYPDPDKRVIINELVCEGCGDCGVQSNCVSIQPVETDFGRKRKIDQTSCNKDFSCVNGFCPSFVTVHGGKLKKSTGLKSIADPLDGVPTPAEFDLNNGWSGIVDGIGGTGIVTVAAILGMAAHLEGKGCGMIDMAGLAQKGGAVFSHVRIAKRPEDISAIRVSAGKADLVLGGDLVVSGYKSVLASARHGETLFAVNTAEVMPGEFTRKADYSLPSTRIKKAIRDAVGEDKAHFFDATRAAQVLFGNSVGANMFLLGFAYQQGGVPLSAEAIEKALELNGQAVQMNIDAFRWGRRAAHDPAFVGQITDDRTKPDAPDTLAQRIEKRTEFLTEYQNQTYGARYQKLIAQVAEAEQNVKPSSEILTKEVVSSLFKLMAIKDEYEVARLYTGAAFQQQLAATFASHDRLEFHLAPPLLGKKDSHGRPVKQRFGGWMMRAFGFLSSMKFLRGTVLDVFGYSAERKMERALLARFEGDVAHIIDHLSAINFNAATTLMSYPMEIKGYGHVKQGNVDRVMVLRKEMMANFNDAKALNAVAAE